MDAQTRELQQFVANSVKLSRRRLKLTSEDVAHIAEILLDQALLYRFLRKCKFILSDAKNALVEHIDWRIESYSFDNTLESLEFGARELLKNGLFRFVGYDSLKRPSVYITPRSFVPIDSNSSICLQKVVQFSMDILRRWVQAENINSSATSIQDKKFVYQISIVVDLEGFGFQNMTLDTIPMIYKLFQKHFPQLIGQVYVLNYGWFHAGAWAALQTVLTSEAASRILFVDSADLPEYTQVSCAPAFSDPSLCEYILAYSISLKQLSSTKEFSDIYLKMVNDYMGPRRIASSPGISSNLFMRPIYSPARNPNEIVRRDSSGSKDRVKSAVDLQYLLHEQVGLRRVPSVKSIASITNTKNNLQVSTDNANGAKKPENKITVTWLYFFAIIAKHVKKRVVLLVALMIFYRIFSKQALLR